MDGEIDDRATQVVRRFVEAMGQDIPAMAGCLDDAFERRSASIGWAPMGRSRYLAMAENFCAPFPDCRWELVDLVADGDKVAVRMTETGTFSHPWTVGNVTVEPNGLSYESPGAVFFEVNDAGLIERYTLVQPSETFTSTYADVLTDEFYAVYAAEFMS
jgi:predicted ester cyclase